MTFSLHRLVGLYLVALAILLTACDTVPPEGELSNDLQTLIEREFANDLFDVDSIEHRETYAVLLSSETELVPFTAELRLLRNYDFGNWQQANVAALLHVLGAQPEKTIGIKPNGNKVGDIIKISGEVIYARDNGKWKILSGAPQISTADTEAPQSSISSFEQAWTAIREAVISLGNPLRRSIYEQRATMNDGPTPEQIGFWQRPWNATRGLIVSLGNPLRRSIYDEIEPEKGDSPIRPYRPSQGLTLASGPEHSTYWKFAEAVRSGTAGDFINISTTSSSESIGMLRDGKARAVIIQSNEAAFAASATGPFELIGASPNLRALASLFPKPIHVLVLVDSTVASVSDLVDKVVAIGATGLLSQTEARDVLRAHRVPFSNLAKNSLTLPLEDALAALASKEVEAVILTADEPSSSVRNFMAKNNARIISLDGDAIALMTSGESNYVALTIPARTYPGQRQPVSTIGITAMLVSSTTVSSQEILYILDKIMNGLEYTRLGSAAGAMVSTKTALIGVTLPLHSGAQYFLNTPVIKSDD